MNKLLPLRLNYEFTVVYRRGKYVPARYVVLHYMKNRLGYNRIGITTGKKVKGSISRNRMRRLLRETYRLKQGKLKQGYDIVLLGRSDPGEIKRDVIDRDIEYLFKKADLFEKRNLPEGTETVIKND